jgi:RNase P/RNase MRP subunit POP5
VKVERQRYIRFRIFSERPAPVDAKELATVIWRQYNGLFGEVKSGKAGFWIIDYDPKTQEGTIRCAHVVQDELVAALTLLTSINDVAVAVDTLRTSGTLAKLAEKTSS